MVLDGCEWKAAMDRHREKPDDAFIHKILGIYRDLGYTYLRDGGDALGAGKRARELSPRYGITYRTPLSPLSLQGCYGGFIGTRFSSLEEYARLVVKNKEEGADFIKIMISGLMDFDSFGVLRLAGPDAGTIRQMVHIAHQEGMAVMAHCNGTRAALAAAEMGVESIEHGAYLEEEALHAMKEAGTVWVPTLSTIGNLLGKGRFPDREVEKILDSAMENVNTFASMGGLLAPGSDAGAWAVPHGAETEHTLLSRAGAGDLTAGIQRITEVF